MAYEREETTNSTDLVGKTDGGTAGSTACKAEVHLSLACKAVPLALCSVKHSQRNTGPGQVKD